ncbi:DUF1573 domain-containing protein [Bacteroidota bacterium]
MLNYRITVSLLFLLIIFSCSQEKSPDLSKNNREEKAEVGEITFEKSVHDLGTILQGETVGYNFVFTNSGKGSLLILDAKSSCGCTVPRTSREPILPGESGSVEVVFDSTGRIGAQTKKVTITTNGREPVVYIFIKANIVKLNS